MRISKFYLVLSKRNIHYFLWKKLLVVVCFIRDNVFEIYSI